MPRPLPHLAPVLVLLAVLAGCSDPPAAAPAEPAQAPADPADLAPASPLVLSANGTTRAGLWEGNVDGKLPLVPFNVTANATAILVEVAWDDPMQDLDARATADVDNCPYDDPSQAGEQAVCTLDSLGGQSGFQFGVFQNSGGGPGAGDSPSRLLVDAGQIQEVLAVCGSPCGWQGRASARAPVADLSWSIWVSVFQGPVPDGYTAIPAGA